MKKINLLYIAILPIAYGVWHISQQYGTHSAVFYGFAENKETEINHDHPVQVLNILVAPGQTVKKGDLLVEVAHAEFDLKLNDLSSDIAAMNLRVDERKVELKNSILLLEAERQRKSGETALEINQLKAEMALNESLLKDLKSIEVPSKNGADTPNQLKIKALQSELALALKPIDEELAAHRQALALANTPLDIQMKKLQYEQGFYEGEQKKLSITAPADGLVGNIRCKVGEHVSSYNSLLSFYEASPTIVNGYVHESLIVHVKVGDTLEVSSSLHPNHSGFGTVIGLGSRIVEIPERLRKVPEFKTYGREVLIAIPLVNPFLQKEKVVLNFLDRAGLPGSSPFSFFSQNKQTPKAESEKTQR